MEDKKIFDEYQVECEGCQHYWNDTCDGVKQGSQKACTSFIATKRTNIPEQIKNLEKRLVRSENNLVIVVTWLLIVTIIMILGVMC